MENDDEDDLSFFLLADTVIDGGLSISILADVSLDCVKSVAFVMLVAGVTSVVLPFVVVVVSVV